MAHEALAQCETIGVPRNGVARNFDFGSLGCCRLKVVADRVVLVPQRFPMLNRGGAEALRESDLKPAW
ncbi:MAG: hypothetical protein HND42_07570 [Armatimonadetes bacterium]|nr:hypothetical protein [Armatimonadota bacterium]NOG93082.1 hypothetical protein [Armatimonadota bacterium]